MEIAILAKGGNLIKNGYVPCYQIISPNDLDSNTIISYKI